MPGDLNALSTNLKLYNLLISDSKDSTPGAGFVDVRDVARGLVAGIKTPGRNRILLSGEWFEYKEAIDYIASVRPELKDRLANIVSAGQTRGIVDNARAQEVLGIQAVIPWKQSVIEVVDTLIKIEKDWTGAGVDIEETLKKNDRRA